MACIDTDQPHEGAGGLLEEHRLHHRLIKLPQVTGGSRCGTHRPRDGQLRENKNKHKILAWTWFLSLLNAVMDPVSFPPHRVRLLQPQGVLEDLTLRLEDAGFSSIFFPSHFLSIPFAY